MRLAFYFLIGIALSAWVATSSLALAKTVEAGDVSTSWIGTGEIHELSDGERVVHGIVNGQLIVRHVKGESGKHVHTAQLVCSIRVATNTKNNQRTQFGLCTVIAHGGKDVGYGLFKCDGGLGECEGEFTFTHGIGGWAGISGTTPMFNRIIFENPKDGKAQVIGYAAWPNLTYTLP